MAQFVAGTVGVRTGTDKDMKTSDNGSSHVQHVTNAGFNSAGAQGTQAVTTTAGTLTIPAGTQLLRLFHAGQTSGAAARVVITLDNSTPVDTDDWPLDVGEKETFPIGPDVVVKLKAVAGGGTQDIRWIAFIAL